MFMYKVIQYGPIPYKYKETIIVGNIISELILRKDGSKTHSKGLSFDSKTI